MEIDYNGPVDIGNDIDELPYLQDCLREYINGELTEIKKNTVYLLTPNSSGEREVIKVIESYYEKSDADTYVISKLAEEFELGVPITRCFKVK